MATVTEKLRFLLEADASGAVRGFRQVGTEVGVAETRMGKFKAALPQVASQMAAVAGVGAVVGGAMFGAAEQFKNLALEAGHLSDATGLTIEQSSRWIEVAGDLGVESSTLTTALGRLNKTISTSPQALADMGVAVQRTKDGAVDVNATFLGLVDRLNAIPDPAKRAEVATKALGRGWQELATVIGAGSGSLKSALADVSDAKIITPEERKRAEEYRDAMDALHDSMQDLAITIGESVGPTLAKLAQSLAELIGPSAQVVAKGVDGLNRFTDASNNAGRAIYEKHKKEEAARKETQAHVMTIEQATAAQLEYQRGMTSLNQEIAADKEAQRRANAEGERWNLIVERMTQQAVDEEFHRAAVAAGDLAEAEGRARDALRDYNREWDELTDEIDQNDAIIGLIEGFDAIAKAHQETADAGKKSAEEQKAAFLREGATINETKRKVIEYGKEILGLPAEQVTQLVAMIDEGSYEDVLRRIQILTRNRNINLDIIARGGAGYGVGARAHGGPVSAGQTYLVGEQGPELLQMGNQSGYVHPNGAMGGVTFMPGAIVINAGIGANGADIGRQAAAALAGALQKYGYR